MCFSLSSLPPAAEATAETQAPQKEIQQQDRNSKEQFTVSAALHTASALPAAHPTMTATARNADTPTSTRDGSERITD